MIENTIRFLVEQYYDVQKLRVEAFNRIVAYVKSRREAEAQDRSASQHENETHPKNASHGIIENHSADASQYEYGTHYNFASHTLPETHAPDASHLEFETQAEDASHTLSETHTIDASQKKYETYSAVASRENIETHPKNASHAEFETHSVYASHTRSETLVKGASQIGGETQNSAASHSIFETQGEDASHFKAETQDECASQKKYETYSDNASHIRSETHFMNASHCVSEAHFDDASLMGNETLQRAPHVYDASHFQFENHGDHASQMLSENHYQTASQGVPETQKSGASQANSETQEADAAKPSLLAKLYVQGKQKPPADISDLVWYHNSLYETEKQLAKRLAGWSSHTKLRTTYLNNVTGIGPIFSSALIAWLSPISRFNNISSLWKYCGLAPGQKRVRGKKLGYNPHLKTLMWKIACSFEKQKPQKSVYRRLYNEQKKVYLAREDLQAAIDKKVKGAKLHVRLMTMRVVEKRFLADLWVAWRRLEGLPVTEPYAIAILKHTGFTVTPLDKTEA